MSLVAPVVRVNDTDSELLRRYRAQLFTATWLSYAGFYLCRKVYAVVKHPLKLQFGFDDEQIALPWTIYLICYMLGQFFAAWLGRRMESRRVLALRHERRGGDATSCLATWWTRTKPACCCGYA